MKQSIQCMHCMKILPILWILLNQCKHIQIILSNHGLSILLKIHAYTHHNRPWNEELVNMYTFFMAAGQFSNHRPSGPMFSISQNVRLCVHVFVFVFTFEVPFKHLFAPLFQSWMSKVFRDFEFLGKVIEQSDLRFENSY